MVERDAVSWAVDIGTIVGILVAVIMAAKAISDSRLTADALAEGRRLLEAAQERADREQAARVLTVAQDLARRIQIFWQRTLVDVETHAPPTPGAVNALRTHAGEDSAVAEELVLRSSGVDLTTVQYARYVRWHFDSLMEKLEGVDRRAVAASPGGGAKPEKIQEHKEQWDLVRDELIGRTVDMLEALQRLEAHFPAAARLPQGTDTHGFIEGLHRELQQGRQARIRAVVQNLRSRPRSPDTED
jgi:hypothetical protein